MIRDKASLIYRTPRDKPVAKEERGEAPLDKIFAPENFKLPLAWHIFTHLAPEMLHPFGTLPGHQPAQTPDIARWGSWEVVSLSHTDIFHKSFTGLVLYPCFASTFQGMIPDGVVFHGFADDGAFKLV